MIIKSNETKTTVMNHQEVWDNEVYVSKSEQRWLNWINSVESLLGHSVDGNQVKDGYSMDYAYDWFKLGSTVMEYVIEVRKQKAKRA